MQLPHLTPLPPRSLPPLPKRKRLSGCAMAGLIIGAAALFIVAVGAVAAIVVPNLQVLKRLAKAETAGREAKAEELHSPPPAFLPLTPPQQQALEAFGEALATAINEKNEERVAQMQDAEALADRAFAGLAGFADAAEARRKFIAETCEGSDGGLIGLAAREGQVKFLRTRERLAHPAVLLRIKSQDGGVGYLEVMVRPDGASFRAVDMFNLLFATTESQEKREELAMRTTGAGNASLAAAFDVPVTDETTLARLQVVYAAFNQGKMKDVVRICDRLPGSLKDKMPFFRPRLLALIRLVSDDPQQAGQEYKTALENARHVLGKDNIIDLVRANLLTSEEDYEGATRCLKHVESVLGGDDSYLKALRAEICYMAGNSEAALALAGEAFKEEPELTEAAALLLRVHLDRKDHAAAVQVLRQHSDGAFDYGAIVKRKGFEELLASPEFKAWEKERALNP